MTTTEATATDQLLDAIEEERGLAGRHALLACATALALDDRLAEHLIRVATGADSVRAGVLMLVVKGLDCVTVERSIRDWFIHAGPRLDLALRAAEELSPETLSRLRRRTAEYADALAADLKPVSLGDYDTRRGLRHEAAYQRLFLPDAETASAAVRAIVELYERADQRGRTSLAASLEFNAPELELLPGGAPAEFAPLRVAARERARTPAPSELALSDVATPTPLYVLADQEVTYPDRILHVCVSEGSRPDPHGGPYALEYVVARCDAVVPAGLARQLRPPIKLEEYVPCEACRASEEFGTRDPRGRRS